MEEKEEEGREEPMTRKWRKGKDNMRRKRMRRRRKI